jgi:ribose 1,5-bisphosphate isomerase
MSRRPSSSSFLPPRISKAIREVESDREHGASWLARRSADILADLCRPEEEAGAYYSRLLALQAAARWLAKSRPSMAAVANTVAYISAGIYPLPESRNEAGSKQRLDRVHNQAKQVRDSWSSAAGTIFSHARPLLGPTLYTHSRSGTVEYALTRLAKERGADNLKTIVSQSHPGNEGIGLATTLAQTGRAEVVLVADAACGLFIGDADAVVIGADSVRADGGIVNKVGTLPLALVAREAGVPVYVLCETLKISGPKSVLAFEEMDSKELLPTPVSGVTVRNVYFDLTPYELITKIITEQGILTPEGILQIARQAEHALTLLDP